MTFAHFRTLLAPYRCYDTDTERIFQETNVPAVDCILQNREELVVLCEWMHANNIQSYLEIGVWTGGLLRCLDTLFSFKTLAACDILNARLYGLTVDLPSHTRLFVGDSQSEDFAAWRSALGHIDFVFIDADHSYEGVRMDFEVNRRYPHRFIGFHDITGANTITEGVQRFWNELDFGIKTEIVRPHAELDLPHSTMGIGIWRAR